MRLRTPRTASPPTDAPWSGDYAPSDDVPVSFIVPVRDEAAAIERTLRALARACDGYARDALEVVVVDAGCSDDTMAVVARVAADRAAALPRVVATASPPAGGRGPAINAGVRAARGDGVLVFVHADTRLPARAPALVRDALGRERACVLCAFRFATDRDEARALGGVAALGVMEATVNLRSRWYELPFGDQALAIGAKRLRELGGFPDFPILEEYELVCRVRRLGAAGGGRIRTLPERAVCSPRRWARRGVWRTNLVNQLVMLWYRFGATPRQIFRFYYGKYPEE